MSEAAFAGSLIHSNASRSVTEGAASMPFLSPVGTAEASIHSDSVEGGSIFIQQIFPVVVPPLVFKLRTAPLLVLATLTKEAASISFFMAGRTLVTYRYPSPVATFSPLPFTRATTVPGASWDFSKLSKAEP